MEEAVAEVNWVEAAGAVVVAVGLTLPGRRRQVEGLAVVEAEEA